ncbi:MAG: hypothetical protein JWQ54_4545 [Mucilaginibacter sp.]|nr:hypothetical protein [Mucilaginibacter sp.]
METIHAEAEIRNFFSPALHARARMGSVWLKLSFRLPSADKLRQKSVNTDGLKRGQGA